MIYCYSLTSINLKVLKRKTKKRLPQEVIKSIDYFIMLPTIGVNRTIQMVNPSNITIGKADHNHIAVVLIILKKNIKFILLYLYNHGILQLNGKIKFFQTFIINSIVIYDVICFFSCVKHFIIAWCFNTDFCCHCKRGILS